jgi:hypothetical protein
MTTVAVRSPSPLVLSDRALAYLVDFFGAIATQAYPVLFGGVSQVGIFTDPRQLQRSA